MTASHLWRLRVYFALEGRAHNENTYARMPAVEGCCHFLAGAVSSVSSVSQRVDNVVVMARHGVCYFFQTAINLAGPPCVCPINWHLD